MYSIFRQAQQGFSYIGLMIMVAILGVVLAATGDLWQTSARREKEAQLLFVGHQFRQAIGRFLQQTPERAKRYPMSLDDLLLDPRYPNPHRYLRQIYSDPMTGTTDWGLVRGPNGEIYGVYSRSDEEPLKKANFDLADIAFEDGQKYSDWQFVYVSRQIKVAPQTPPAKPLTTPARNRR